MKIQLQNLLPADVSSDVAFHLVKFVRDLGLALESVYFDQMLHHTSTCEHDPFAHDPFAHDPFAVEEEDNHAPF